METDVLVRTRPKPGYWLLYLLVMPFAGFIFSAILLGVARAAIGFQLHRPLLFGAWALLTVVFAAWALPRDLRGLYATLAGDSLRLGRREDRVVPFDEIESIVVGLPPELPRWTFWMKLNRSAYQGAVIARRNTVLVRLSGRRYLALRFTSPMIRGGPELIGRFLELNRWKVVGPETYTAEETEKLRLPRLHEIASF